MSSDKVNEQLRKIFVGGLNKDVTTEESLKTQFSAWGGIIDCAVMRDRDKRSRGFGFVLFDNSACVDDIMKAKREGERFEVDGNNIEVKRALPRTEGGSSSFFSSGRESRGTRKIFVGGLASSTTADDVADYFSKFGKIEDVELLKDRATGNLRGFGFVTFEDEDSADKVCAMREHSIKMKLCEVKKAESRSSMMRKRERDRDRRDDYRYRDRDRDYGSRDRDYGSRNQSYAGADALGGGGGGGLAALQALGTLLQAAQQPQAPAPAPVLGQGLNANLDLNSIAALLRNASNTQQGLGVQNQGNALQSGSGFQGGGGVGGATNASNLGANLGALGALGASLGGNQNQQPAGANPLLNALGSSGVQGLAQLVGLASLAGLSGGATQGNQGSGSSQGFSSGDLGSSGFSQGSQGTSSSRYQDAAQGSGDYSSGYSTISSTANVTYPTYDDSAYNSIYSQTSSNFGPVKSTTPKTSQSSSRSGSYRPY